MTSTPVPVKGQGVGPPPGGGKPAESGNKRQRSRNQTKDGTTTTTTTTPLRHKQDLQSQSPIPIHSSSPSSPPPPPTSPLSPLSNPTAAVLDGSSPKPSPESSSNSVDKKSDKVLTTGQQSADSAQNPKEDLKVSKDSNPADDSVDGPPGSGGSGPDSRVTHPSPCDDSEETLRAAESKHSVTAVSVSGVSDSTAGIEEKGANHTETIPEPGHDRDTATTLGMASSEGVVTTTTTTTGGVASSEGTLTKNELQEEEVRKDDFAESAVVASSPPASSTPPLTSSPEAPKVADIPGDIISSDAGTSPSKTEGKATPSELISTDMQQQQQQPQNVKSAGNEIPGNDREVTNQEEGGGAVAQKEKQEETDPRCSDPEELEKMKKVYSVLPLIRPPWDQSKCPD